MSRILFTLLLTLAAALSFSHTTLAHESRPAYLELKETSPGDFDVTWRRPARGDKALSLAPEFPAHCLTPENPASYFVGGAYIERWRIECGETGLLDQAISIRGLEFTLTDVLIRVEQAQGVVRSGIVKPNAPSFIVERSPSAWKVIVDYLVLGVEHILGGIDHLLFVLGLMLIVSGTRRLIQTITAFTVAHSITLGAATLGFVKVPQAPVEAVIALSILFLATELIRREEGHEGLASRFPWVVAFIFGLLHGFGFAGALTEVGLPQNEIPLALLMFNIGVELGQILFVATVLLFLYIIQRNVKNLPSWGPRATAYGIGSLAAFWIFDRVGGFW
jgi:hydrogenase/urease accessory protein HupE